jgi:predicted nucleic acid-binding protein
MRTALDTNILSLIWSEGPVTPRILSALQAAKREGSLVISPAVYAESLAYPDYSEEEVIRFLDATGIAIDYQMSDSVWTEAGRRYGQYAANRRKSIRENPRRLLADFIIGAHALIHANRLMTMDKSNFRQYFPELALYPIEE